MDFPTMASWRTFWVYFSFCSLYLWSWLEITLFLCSSLSASLFVSDTSQPIRGFPYVHSSLTTLRWDHSLVHVWGETHTHRSPAPARVCRCDIEALLQAGQVCVCLCRGGEAENNLLLEKGVVVIATALCLCEQCEQRAGCVSLSVCVTWEANLWMICFSAVTKVIDEDYNRTWLEMNQQ